MDRVHYVAVRYRAAARRRRHVRQPIGDTGRIGRPSGRERADRPRLARAAHALLGSTEIGTPTGHFRTLGQLHRLGRRWPPLNGQAATTNGGALEVSTVFRVSTVTWTMGVHAVDSRRAPSHRSGEGVALRRFPRGWSRDQPAVSSRARSSAGSRKGSAARCSNSGVTQPAVSRSPPRLPPTICR